MGQNNIKWWQRSVAYQVYPKSFQDTNNDGVGDLEGIRRRLDYLEKLGIDLLWISPVNKSPMKDNGYDISDYYQIDPLFGKNEDMYRLIKEADSRGNRVIMDLVVNHCSDQHEWFQKALKDPEGEYAQYFYFRKGDGENPPNNWRSIFGGSAWEKIPDSEYYYLHIFAKEQVDLNWENPKLRNEIYDMMNFWLEKGIAGFRLDAITYIKKEAGLPSFPPDAADGLVSVRYGSLARPGIEAFLEEMKEKTYGRRECFTVGEVAGVEGEKAIPFISLKDGYFSAIFDVSHLNMDLKGPNFFWCDRKEWTADELRDALLDSQEAIQPEGWIATFLECHDMPRCIDYLLPAEGRNFYGASMLAVLYLYLRGTPFIYQGQEIGMRNFPFADIDDYDDCSSHGEYNYALSCGYSKEEALNFVQLRSRDNTRYPMSWNKGKNAGFSEAAPWLPVHPNHTKINVEDQEKDENSLLHFYRKLIALRKSKEYGDIFCFGDLKKIFPEHHSIFAYQRSYQDHTVSVICNNQNGDYRLPYKMQGNILINNYPDLRVTENGDLLLLPFQAVVLDGKMEGHVNAVQK